MLCCICIWHPEDCAWLTHPSLDVVLHLHLALGRLHGQPILHSTLCCIYIWHSEDCAWPTHPSLNAVLHLHMARGKLRGRPILHSMLCYIGIAPGRLCTADPPLAQCRVTSAYGTWKTVHGRQPSTSAEKRVRFTDNCTSRHRTC